MADTLEAGGSLCEREVVERVIREAPKRIEELVRWGTKFDRVDDHLALSREGGHGFNRIAHALGGRHRQGSRPGDDPSSPADPEHRDLGADVYDRPAHPRGKLPRGLGLGTASTARRSSGPSKPSSVPAGPAKSTAKRPIPTLPRPTAWRWPTGPASNCATWSSCSFHPTVLYVAGSSRDLITEAMRGEVGAPGRPFRAPLHAGIRRPRGIGPSRRRQVGPSSVRWRRPATPTSI